MATQRTRVKRTPRRERPGPTIEKARDVICCDTCFFVDLADGECRRHPPTVFVAPEDELGAEWPAVAEGEWCGEWREASSMKSLEQVWTESDGMVDFGGEAEEEEEDEEEADSD